MIKKDAPSWFISELKNHDPNLRVRWSYEKGKFAIEEKTDRRFLYKPVKYVKTGYGDKLKEVTLPEKSDIYIQYHDSYSTIIYCSHCSKSVLEQIYRMDMARSAEKKKLSREADERDMAREKREEQIAQDNRYAMANDMYDTIKRKIGDTIVVGSEKVSDSEWY